MRTIIAEDSEHAAFLTGDRVTVFRKADMGTLVPIGHGTWQDGIVRGSGVNCGVLVRLEPDLRALTGTA